MRNLNKTEITVFDEILHYAKKFFKKNQLFYVFSKFHLCFTFKNASNCSFKYFQSSGIILVKKEILLKVY